MNPAGVADRVRDGCDAADGGGELANPGTSAFPGSGAAARILQTPTDPGRDGTPATRVTPADELIKRSRSAEPHQPNRSHGQPT